MHKLEHPVTPIIDPGANLGWYSQTEQGHALKITVGDDSDELDDDDEDDGDDDDDDDDKPDPDEGKSLEELRAELGRVRASLNTAAGSSRAKRDKIKALKAELAGKGGKPKADGDDDKPDLDAIRREAREEALTEAKKVRIADKSELALSRSGVDPAKLAKAVKLLDLDDVDLNDDGTLDGLDEQIAELKDEWPELFGTRRKRREVGGPRDRDGGERRATPKTTDQIQAEQMRGSRR